MELKKPHIRRNVNTGDWSCRAGFKWSPQDAFPKLRHGWSEEHKKCSIELETRLVWPQHGATPTEAYLKWDDERRKVLATLANLRVLAAAKHHLTMWQRLRDALRS